MLPVARSVPALAIALLLLAYGSAARAATVEIGPEGDVKAAVAALQPGDELVLRGGTYAITGRWGVSLAGTAAAPIVIRAKDGERPVLARADASQNIVDLDGVHFTTLRGLEFSGGSRGIRIIAASDLTIEGCEVHDTDDVAIAANDVGSDYARISILRSEVHDTGGTGEGMYLGCNDHRCSFHDGVIAENHIHHTNASDVEQGDGIEIKEGSYGNVVRDNVIHDTHYPCIITYGTEGGAANVIERNVLWGCGDYGIQSAADVVIRNNIILGAVSGGVASQPHQSATPSNVQIVNNTILAPTQAAIRATGITGSVVVANNALYAAAGAALRLEGELGQVVVKNNVGTGDLVGVTTGLTQGALESDLVTASMSGTVPNDVFPKAGSKLIGAGAPEYLPADDFNRTTRGGAADVGAYAFAATNPGWTLAAGFKAFPPGAGDGDGPADGAGPGAGGATGADDGANGANGANGAPASPGAADDSGCGCRAASASASRARTVTGGLALAGLALVALRRRRALKGQERRAPNGAKKASASARIRGTDAPSS